MHLCTRLARADGRARLVHDGDVHGGGREQRHRLLADHLEALVRGVAQRRQQERLRGVHRTVLSPDHLLRMCCVGMTPRQPVARAANAARNPSMRSACCEHTNKGCNGSTTLCQPHLFGAEKIAAAEGVQLGQRGRAGLPVHVRCEQVLPRHRVPAGVRLHSSSSVIRVARANAPVRGHKPRRDQRGARVDASLLKVSTTAVVASVYPQ